MGAARAANGDAGDPGPRTCQILFVAAIFMDVVAKISSAMVTARVTRPSMSDGGAASSAPPPRGSDAGLANARAGRRRGRAAARGACSSAAADAASASRSAARMACADAREGRRGAAAFGKRFRSCLGLFEKVQ